MGVPTQIQRTQIQVMSKQENGPFSWDAPSHVYAPEAQYTILDFSSFKHRKEKEDNDYQRLQLSKITIIKITVIKFQIIS